MFVRVVTFVGWYGCDKVPSDCNSIVVALLREANFRVVGSLVAVFFAWTLLLCNTLRGVFF